MSTYFRLTEPGRQYLDDNGDPANGYQLFVYIAGTTTKATTYKDNAGAASHTNPIILGSDGKIPGNEMWVLTGSYKLVLATAADTDPPSSGETLGDNLVGVNDVGSSSVSEWVASGITPTRTGNTTFTMTGDQTTVFHIGRRLQFTDSSTLYGTISASTYSAPDTTVTVTMDSGSLSASLSAVAYGIVSYVNPSIVPNGVELIASGTASAASTLDFLGLSSKYTSYRLTMEDIVLGSDGALFRLRVSTDGSTFDSGASDYAGVGTDTRAGGDALLYSTGSAQLPIGNQSLGNAANERHGAVIEVIGLSNPGSFTRAFFQVHGSNSSGSLVNLQGSGQRSAEQAETAFQVFFSVGTFSCEYALYGYLA
jgi:hypothetical protein